MPSQRSLRVAIAEDEFFLAEDLRQLVEASGHEVVGVVATAPELVALVRHWRPDLALVDIQFARGSNGLDAAKVIKAQHGVPAIAVTANPDEERARKAGLLGHVPKPDASAVLAAVLRAAAEWLEKGRVEEHSSRFSFVGRWTLLFQRKWLLDTRVPGSAHSYARPAPGWAEAHRRTPRA